MARKTQGAAVAAGAVPVTVECEGVKPQRVTVVARQDAIVQRIRKESGMYKVSVNVGGEIVECTLNRGTPRAAVNSVIRFVMEAAAE